MPARVQLTLWQKKAILDEQRRRITECLTTDQRSLAEWAHKALKLSACPGQATISRILATGVKITCVRDQVRQRAAAFPNFEDALLEWVTAQFAARRAVNGPMIIEAGRRLMNCMNATLDSNSKITLTLSNGWLYNFQRRKGLKSLQSHGESGDADEEEIASRLPQLRELVKSFAVEDRFNADEFGLFYRMAPDRTIATARLPGRKKQKVRLTFLACANADGSERFPLLIIGNAKKPRCFSNNSGQELGFDYHNNKKAWMNTGIFQEWLGRFSGYIRRCSPERKVLLLIDNASCHGSDESLIRYYNVRVAFLPPRTTSRLQPLDAGIIAALKKRYRRFQYERVVENADTESTDIYYIDQLSAMKAMRSLWKDIPNKVFYNCWLHTKLMDGPQYNKRCREEEHDVDESLLSVVNQLIPESQHRRIEISSLLNLDNEDDCIADVSLEEIAASHVPDEIVEKTAQNSDNEEQSPLQLLSVKEKLRAVTITKWMMEDQGVVSGETLADLRTLYRLLKRDTISRMRQSRLTSFFAAE